jgi:hypothetical protein
MDLASIGYLYAMQAIKLGKKRVWVFLYVVVVILQDFAKKLMLGVVYRFDDILIIAGEIEKAATLTRGPEL